MLKYILIGTGLTIGMPCAALAQNNHIAAHSASSHKSLTEEQKVEELISYLRNLEGATFIRNGSEYDSQKAADHLQSKWDKHKDQVHTAEGFIDELASKSGFSGKAYLIRFKDGKTLTTSQVLHQQLAQLEQ